MFDDSTYRIRSRKPIRREEDRLLPQPLPPLFPSLRRMCARPLRAASLAVAVLAPRR